MIVYVCTVCTYRLSILSVCIEDHEVIVMEQEEYNEACMWYCLIREW